MTKKCLFRSTFDLFQYFYLVFFKEKQVIEFMSGRGVAPCWSGSWFMLNQRLSRRVGV